jgi:FKBP-type peptidyl-prolyl cis-trans isomerase
MKGIHYISLLPVLLAVAACGPAEQSPPEAAPQAEGRAPSARAATTPAEPVEIEPGLTMRTLNVGRGETAEPGKTAVVHYTGWLHDENAADKRGKKFDSSVDRGQYFEFPLGAGAVIAGWDRGVAGMRVGEVRELTIAPELAYGERGRPPVIPPSSTLVFEVELADVVGGDTSATDQ